MKIRNFGVEIWMNKYETTCELNLAETCVESLTVAELLDMAGKTDIAAELLPLKLTYGEIEGSVRLRNLVAGLYENQKLENTVITHGAIGANALVHLTLVERGDRVISVLPTYQQHYSIPESIGADIQILELTEKTGFLPIHTNGFDRGFIAVVLLIAIHLFWMRFVEQSLSIYVATAISLVLGYVIIKKG